MREIIVRPRPVFLSLAALSPGFLLIATAAWAQPVTFSDLEGLIVEADVHRDTHIRLQGGPASLRIQHSWKISIGAENSGEFTFDSTVRSPRGTQKAPRNSDAFTLEKPHKVLTRGGGEAVWKFADETLTFIRTFPSGAYRATIAFARTPSGFDCIINAAFARLDGKGEIKLHSPFGEGEYTITSDKQLSSTCKVSKKQQD